LLRTPRPTQGSRADDDDDDEIHCGIILSPNDSICWIHGK
jgi:hypothetical protein